MSGARWTRQAGSGLLFSLAILAIGLWMTGCGENNQNAPGSSEANSEMVAAGAASFQEFCANCHGQEGDGFGAAVGGVQTLPPDLTRLSIENGGEFPEDRVRLSIDGREDLEVHGPSEMPAWGNVLNQETADERIDEVIAFLESIQKTQEA